MKNAEIKELTIKEVEDKIVETKQLLVKQRLNHAVSPLENPLVIKQLRRDIARYKTELRAREIKENK
jgi:large subunit ribosomal protein L29